MWVERLAFLIFWLVVASLAIPALIFGVGGILTVADHVKTRMRDIRNCRDHRVGKYPSCTETHHGEMCVLHKGHLTDRHAGDWKTSTVDQTKYRLRWGKINVAGGGNSEVSFCENQGTATKS